MSQQFQASFDNFRIDINQGVFLKNGEKINLRPKELAVLWLLVQRTGELVSKDQIIQVVWHGSPTSDESIARCISVIKTRLRSASPGADELIKTEYGRGYRFVGNISLVLERRIHKPQKKPQLSPPTLVILPPKIFWLAPLPPPFTKQQAYLAPNKKAQL